MSPHAVILRHTLPDASTHLDLLLERAPPDAAAAANPDDRRLIAFRLPDPLPDPPEGLIDATRLPDHRAHYLTHEGPIGDNRGHVARILRAPLVHLVESPDACSARLRAPDHDLLFEATRVHAQHWRIALSRP
ncbi:MAG: hypothetical protein ACIARR_11915 [Phycisphaerales bacterium JB059]